MRKLLLAFAVLVSACCTAAGGGVKGLNNLDLKQLKIPFYEKEKLKLIIFSAAGRQQNDFIISEGTFLDVLQDEIDVDRIPDGWKEKIYPLKAGISQILDFWRPRIRISKAVVFTPHSLIDQKRSEASGDDPVFIRHPSFDLDGVGFNANFKERVIEVNSDVKIVVRSADSDPGKLLAGAPMPKTLRVITATSDSLRLDELNNELMLIGNVRVVDGRNILTCDRMTVFGKPGNDNSADLPVISSDDEKAVLSNVSRVLADGNVLLEQYPLDPALNSTELQTSRSEHLEYEVDIDKIILTGEKKVPLLTRGIDTRLTGKRIELLRHEDKVFVIGDCRVTSLVRNANGTVSHIRDITSDRADYDGKTHTANFHGKVFATDRKATLATEDLRVHLTQDEKSSSQKIDRLFCSGGVKIVSLDDKELPAKPGKPGKSGRAEKAEKTAKAGKTGALPPQSTITARQAELNYGANKMIFYQEVRVRDDSATLDCDRLDLLLADRKEPANGVNPGTPLASGMEARGKTITKMIASGKVFMTSKEDELHTDILTLFFRDLPPGMKPSPGMFQSGGVQLTKILCDGAVLAISKEKPKDPKPADGKPADGKPADSKPADGKPAAVNTRTLKAANAMSDLLADYSEFHGNVIIDDGATEIHCRDMYVFTGASPINEEVVENKTVAAQKPPPEEKSIDDDPFALDMGENSVPTRIAISDNRDIKRIVCKKEVVLVHRDKDGKLQRAGGDMGVYTVDTREVVLTAERPRRPWLRAEGRKQFCDIIRSDLETGDLQGIGNVQVMPDEAPPDR